MENENIFNLYSATYLTKKLISQIKKTLDEERDMLREAIVDIYEEFKEAEDNYIEIVDNDDEDIIKKRGLYSIDFGNRIRYYGHLKEDGVTLFTIRGMQRDTLPLKLIAKDDLCKHLGLKGKEKTWSNIVKGLNNYIEENKLSLKKGEPYLMAKRTKDLDADLALDVILKGGEGFWVNELKRMKEDADKVLSSDLTMDKRKKTIERIEGAVNIFTAKVTENFEENPYVSLQEGRESIPRNIEEAFIEELQDINMDLAIKLSKEGKGEDSIVVVDTFTYDEIMHPRGKLLNLLERKYEDKNLYIAGKENEEIFFGINEENYSTIAMK